MQNTNMWLFCIPLLQKDFSPTPPLQIKWKGLPCPTQSQKKYSSILFCKPCPIVHWNVHCPTMLEEGVPGILSSSLNAPLPKITLVKKNIVLCTTHYIILKYQLVQTLYPAALPFSIIFMIKQSYQGFHVFSYSLILFIPTNNKIYSRVSIVFKENVVQVNVSKLTMLIMKERNLS